MSAQRKRNNQQVLDAWQHHTLPSFIDIIEKYQMDDPVHRAWIGAAFEWMLTWPQAPELIKQIFRYARLGKPWKTEHLVALLQVDDVGQIEQQWDLWVLSLQQIRSQWGSVSPEDLLILQESLSVSPEIISVITQEDTGQTLSVHDLIVQRESEWMPVLCRFMGMRVQSLGIGRSLEFQAVLNEYAMFFQQLGERRKGLFSKPVARYSQEELYKSLQRAEDVLRQLEATMEDGTGACLP